MSEPVEVAEILTRPTCPALDEILGKVFPVLDKGFVRVVDYMGDDGAICQAARVSYGKGTKKVSEDEGLIRYLLRQTHTTPFEQCELKLHVRIPMDAHRQFVRHRTANINEYSTRYSEAIDDKQQTAPDKWRLQSGTNKQGSSGVLAEWPAAWSKEKIDAHKMIGQTSLPTPGEYLSFRESVFHDNAASLYQERLDFGVAKEVARKDLPLSSYTELYWKCDLHNILHFLSLRMDAHAQEEIRAYASVIGNEIVAKWCPLAWAAFNDYHFRRDALLLSARDKAVIHAMVNPGGESLEDYDQELLRVARETMMPTCEFIASSFGWMERRESGTLKDNRERIEFEKKIEQLGLTVPW